MSLSARLLLPLLATLSVVMLGYALWSLQQRESVMVAESERETRAYATALGLALERGIGEEDLAAVREMIDRIDREPSIYGVVVYDTLGSARFVSAPLRSAAPVPAGEVRTSLASGQVRVLRRDVQGEESIVVLRPLVDETGAPVGILEVVQPLTSVNEQLARTRLRFLLNTLTLGVAVTLLLSWLVRRHLSRPLTEFVRAVRALGSGDLAHRVEPAMAVGELNEVAEELNRMADRLGDARRDLVRQAEERVSLERRLVQSEKLAEVGALAAGLAHEIGAPLHVIRGRAELVRTSEPDSVGRDRNLRIIIDQIDRIAVIVRSLLGFARRREPRMAVVDLVEIVRGVVDFIDVEAQKAGAAVRLRVFDEKAPVRGDADLLHQVFLNVLLNALHAVADASNAGEVAVSIESVTGAAGSTFVVSIEDNGPGIPAELRDRVFEPFFTTKATGRGTGLGLALGRGIMEDHGGSITVSGPSASRWSTRIRIEIPAMVVAPDVAQIPVIHG